MYVYVCMPVCINVLRYVCMFKCIYGMRMVVISDGHHHSEVTTEIFSLSSCAIIALSVGLP